MDGIKRETLVYETSLRLEVVRTKVSWFTLKGHLVNQFLYS